MKDRHLRVESLHERLTGSARPWMLMLLGSVTCVLLIACVNVANLLLVRATVRARELSVRSALGATRWDLARMLLAESLLLSTPNEDPIGRIVTLDGTRTIVGVVGDVRASGPEADVRYDLFIPMVQAEPVSGTLLLRTSGSNAAIVPHVKAAIWSEFPDIAIPAPRMLEENYVGYVAERRFNMFLVSLFGILGVTIACVGIYGVMTYVVTQRTREIGIRMALGALSSTILWSVLRRASTHVALGLLLGLGLAWLLSRSIERFLFRVEPHDLALYIAICCLLVSAALIAAFFPARRATKIDPMIALKME